MTNCGISGSGAESLARVLAANKSLEYLDLSINNISDTGAAQLSNALRVNNSLESLDVGGDTITDAAVLSLVDALKTNTSLTDMSLQWSSTHPDYTLKLMAEIFKDIMLNTISLYIMVHDALTVSSEEEVVEWIQRVEVGAKELILSLEDNCHLELLRLELFSNCFLESSSLSAVRLQTRISLKTAVASVNSVRSEKKNCCELTFYCTID